MVTKSLQLVVYLMLLGSSCPYPWLILEENGRWNDGDDIREFSYFSADANCIRWFGHDEAGRHHWKRGSSSSGGPWKATCSSSHVRNNEIRPPDLQERLSNWNLQTTATSELQRSVHWIAICMEKNKFVRLNQVRVLIVYSMEKLVLCSGSRVSGGLSRALKNLKFPQKGAWLGMRWFEEQSEKGI